MSGPISRRSGPNSPVIGGASPPAGRTGTPSRPNDPAIAFESVAREASVLSATKQAEIAAIETRAEADLAADPGFQAAYGPAKRANDAATLRVLLAEREPETLRSVVARADSAKRLLGAASSFRALAAALASPIEAEALGEAPDALVRQHARFSRMSRDVAAVRKAIESAGAECEAVGRFPVAQLDAIDGALHRELTRLDEARARVAPGGAPKVLHADRLGSVEGSAAALAESLGDPALAKELVWALDRVPPAEQAAWKASLAAVVRLADQALSAPDYAKSGMGWQYPSSRREYRAAVYDPWVQLAAKPRQEASRAALLEALRGVARSGQPGAALDRALVGRFAAEIGADPALTAGANADAVRRALDKEALLALRALNETSEDMADNALRPKVRDLFAAQKPAPARPELASRIKRLVTELTGHILTGDYRDWRYENLRSAVQLAALSPERARAWRDGSLSIEHRGSANNRLRTREEDDVELLWVTKIGGPSHGFDYGGNCLLPLLSNGRTKAILVDDERWNGNASTRAYLRMLPLADGTPTLYLEPTQRDFPHRRAYDGQNKEYEPAETGSVMGALIRHAMAKADQLGLELSLPDEYKGTLEFMGIPFRVERRRYAVEPSAGLFEASDTLGLGHDFLNDERVLTPPLERLVIGGGRR
jgi:hypothetical protein